MKKWNQTDEQIQAIIEASDGMLKIASGEGETGTDEDYDGEMTVKAIKAVIKKERCGGDRWAYVDTYDGHAVMGLI